MDLKERLEIVKAIQLNYEVQGYLSTNDADYLIDTIKQMKKQINFWKDLAESCECNN
jgi:hypothetical protein